MPSIWSRPRVCRLVKSETDKTQRQTAAPMTPITNCANQKAFEHPH